MAILFKWPFKYLFWLIILLFLSCRSEKFATEGYFTGEVDKYFNQKEGLNIWVYRAFQPMENGHTGLRTKNLYPLDLRFMKMLGLGRRGDKILLSVVPEGSPKYNMVVVRHINQRFKLEEFELRKYQNAAFYIKDYSNDDMVMVKLGRA